MISIVVPVYNSQSYISTCIESILSQTYADWELLLINNGSADNSLELCRSYADKDARIRIFHQEKNEGVSVARNLGIREAVGEWITFIDADDWVAADYLETLLGMQEKQRVSVAVCGYKKVYEKDRSAAAGVLENKSMAPEADTGRELWTLWDRKRFIAEHMLAGNVHCWGILFETAWLRERSILFPEGITIGEDLIFLTEAALAAAHVAVTEYTGYGYYINPAGAMNRAFTPAFMDQIICWQKAGEKILALYPEFRETMESICLVSVMLVVGKLAQADPKTTEKYEECLRVCKEEVRRLAEKPGVRKRLPSGYGMKVALFRYAPGLYLRLYGRWKG
ncbi:MAG: glycosyltransferase family 2 protein [Lachnospiraceae bacterium]|nr:glycosyltransferase family 2 protein [Lachnospiraceae bacterium]